MGLGVIVGCAACEGGVWKEPDPAERNLAMTGTVSNEFALNLYRRLASDAGAGRNLFFSPSSLTTAMAMAHAGAKGETADQIASVLHLQPGVSPGGFTGKAQSPGNELAVANAMWGQRGYGFAADYVGRLEREFGAALFELDFAANAGAARKRINDWAERQTHGRIKDLMPPPTVTSDTVLVLTNAVYFKGKWQRPFDPRSTAEAPFFVSVDAPVNVPMMSQRGRFRRVIRDGAQALELPYGGGEVSMVILLPDDCDGLTKLEQTLTSEALDGWLTDVSQAPAESLAVTIPKFTTSGEFSLAQTLAAMGMPDAFDFAKADFSGMNGGKERLAISVVVHKAFVAVDEEGTEAAAATGVAVTRTAALKPAPPFRADHPFLFVIREAKSGNVLFLGRVMNPK